MDSNDGTPGGMPSGMLAAEPAAPAAAPSPDEVASMETDADKSIAIEDFKEQFESINKYVDEVFKDLETQYRNAFDAIEKQFGQIFDKINHFEASLNEVLSSSGAAASPAAEGSQPGERAAAAHEL